MKRSFKRPDGTEETVEGTAEELAEYERRLRGEISEQKKPPPVLKGAEVDGVPLNEEEISWVRLWRAVRATPKLPEVPTWPIYPIIQPPVIYRQWTSDRTWTWNPCKWCGNQDCHQSHVICEGPNPLPQTTLTCGSMTVDGSGLMKMIEEHPDWDWTGINVCGGNWHVQ